MSLSLKHISKSYNAIEVLKGLSFNIKRGELVGIIGPNGAGKTTLFKILCGLIKTDTGLISYHGQEIDLSDIVWKKRIGYLPEHNPLYNDMYVEQFLTHIARLCKVNEKSCRIEDIIKKVGLEDQRKKHIRYLSKGFKQRLGLAQAILHDPEILILDEPTSGLDPGQLVQIRLLIKELSKNRIILVSSHILSEVREICSRIIMINKGKIALDRSNEDSSVSFVKVVFDRDVKPDWFSKLGKVEQQSNLKKEINIELFDLKSRADIFDIAVEKKMRIIEMTMEKTNLEREFLSLSQ